MGCNDGDRHVTRDQSENIECPPPPYTHLGRRDAQFKLGFISLSGLSRKYLDVHILRDLVRVVRKCKPHHKTGREHERCRDVNSVETPLQLVVSYVDHNDVHDRR